MATKVKAEEPCTISFGALLLIAPPILFYILSDLLYYFSGWHGVGNAPVATAMEQAHAEAMSRLLVLAGFLAVAGVSFFAFLSMGADLKRLFGPIARARLLLGMAAGVLVAAIYFSTLGQGIPVQEYVGRTLLSTAAQEFDKLESCVPKIDPVPAPTPTPTATPAAQPSPAPTATPKPLVCTKKPSTAMPLIKRFWWIMFAMRALLILAAGAVIGGAVSCLSQPTGTLADKPAEFLAGQRRRLKRYVDLAALLMVSGMAFMIAWMRWPLALMTGTAAANYAAYVDALGVFFGVTYSLVIASYALPVTAVLRTRVAAHLRDNPPAAPADPANPAPDEPDLLDKNFMQSLGKVLVVLAPALASLVPSVVDALTSLG